MVGFFCSVCVRYLLFFTLPKSRRTATIFMLLAENRLLKRQLAQQRQRPRFTTFVRSLFVQLLTRFPGIRKYLTIVSPDTVLKVWKHQVRNSWCYPCTTKARGRPRIPATVRDLILEIKSRNPSYGYQRIAGELRTLAIEVSRESIRRVLHNGYKNGDLQPVGTWKQFLAAHWNSLFCCDFFTVDTLGFKGFYVFFILKLKTRSITQFGITTNPTMAFVTNQLKGFLYTRHEQDTGLIHDNSGELRWCNYAQLGIRGVAITPGSPNMNAYAERFIGSIRREILDKMLIFNTRQLHTVVRQYVDWYNNHRPHQGIGNQCPNRAPPQSHGTIRSKPVLFGMYHTYYREAS